MERDFVRVCKLDFTSFTGWRRIVAFLPRIERLSNAVLSTAFAHACNSTVLHIKPVTPFQLVDTARLEATRARFPALRGLAVTFTSQSPWRRNSPLNDEECEELFAKLTAIFCGVTLIESLNLKGSFAGPALPRRVLQFDNLRSLNVDGNDLVALPDEIGSLGTMVAFTCSANELEALPESIGALTRLERFDCSGNEIKALPESIGALTRLVRFDCYANEIKALPESIGALTRLVRFDCSGNLLAALPPSIGELRRLEDLDASDNRLTALPESIGGLAALVKLNGSSNAIRALPHSLGALRTLVDVDLSENPVGMALPPSMQALSKVSLFDVYRYCSTTMSSCDFCIVLASCACAHPLTARSP